MVRNQLIKMATDSLFDLMKYQPEHRAEFVIFERTKDGRT